MTTTTTLQFMPITRPRPTMPLLPLSSFPLFPMTPAGNAGLRLPSDCYALKSSFLSSSLHILFLSGQTLPHPQPLTQPKFSMRVASKQAYICRDCGYIYNERAPFEKLPDTFFCPVCGAPKRRFRRYEPAVSKNVNETATRKARKEELKKDEAIGRALPVAVVAGLLALAGLYWYLNNATTF